MNKNFDVDYKNNLQIQANFVESYLSDEKYKLLLEAMAIADSALMRNFFYEKTRKSYDKLVSYMNNRYNIKMFTITNSDGFVLFGGDTLPAGYKVRADIMIKALRGEATSDIVNFMKNGISICAASPIIVNKKLVGAFMVGNSLKTNQLVDKIKKISNIDMTIFDGDVRISTTIIQDGHRAIGTKLDNYNYILDIINRETVYNEDVDILGVPYKSIYWPLLNNNRDRIGLLFVGNPQHDARKMIVYSFLVCFISSTLLSILLCISCIYFFNGVVTPLKVESITDNLTGILNRRGIEALFKIAFKRHNGVGSFILIDLDNFKDVNDNLGHGVGDQVLRHTACELKKFFRNSDVVGRIGGDEFIIYAPDLCEYTIIEDRMRELVKILKYGFNLGGNDTLFVTASIGIAVCPCDGCTYKKLLHNADLALYNIKNTGRNGFGFYGSGRCY